MLENIISQTLVPNVVPAWMWQYKCRHNTMNDIAVHDTVLQNVNKYIPGQNESTMVLPFSW